MKSRYKGLSKRQEFLTACCLRLMARTYEVYQPIMAKDKQICAGVRSVHQRWESIKGAIHEYQIKTVLDIGCAEGYFTLSAAKECGCTATGIDGDARRLWFATQQALLNGTMGTAFVYADISPEFCSGLPSYDMTIFMSVLHHYLAYDGYDKAMNVTRALLTKTNKVMIFESGYSNEKLNLAGLPDMGNDPIDWYSSFLQKAGAKNISVLSESSGYDTSVTRHLFAVIP